MMLISSAKTEPLGSEDASPQIRLRQAAETAATTALRNRLSPIPKVGVLIRAERLSKMKKATVIFMRTSFEFVMIMMGIKIFMIISELNFLKFAVDGLEIVLTLNSLYKIIG